MRIRRTALSAGLAVAALALAACGSSAGGTTGTGTSSSPTASSMGAITIGAFDFGESKILAYLYSGVLAKAGYDPTVKVVGNRELTEPALEAGSAGQGVDVVPEYLATFTTFLNSKANGADATSPASGDVDATLAAGQTLANAVGISLLTPSAAADQNSFAVTKDFATKNNLTTLSDLGSYTGPLVLGGPPECPKRPFCQPGLEDTYRSRSPGSRRSTRVARSPSRRSLTAPCRSGWSSRPTAASPTSGLQVLTDDKGLQAADNVVPAVNTTSVSDALTAALNSLSAVLTTDDLIALNAKVDIDREDPDAVAAAYLTSKGLA